MRSRAPWTWTPGGLMARVRSLWRGLRRRADVETEMAAEFRHHLELRTLDLVRRGLSPAEAARRARLEFGPIETQKETARAARGLHAFDQIAFSWLDVKLGVRMLRKYPGLSLVSVIGMSVAIAIAAGGFGIVRSVLNVQLPLEEGDRLVALQNSNTRMPGSPDRRAVHDFLAWRERLLSVNDLSAFTPSEETLAVPGTGPSVVKVARMTASGFGVARVAPMLGRPLLEADERGDAVPVVVIAYQEWQRRLDGDPEIIGRSLQLGAIDYTVVGVMPEGFRFPIDHGYWVPLRLDPDAWAVGAGPAIRIFARLADDSTLESAQAELTAIGERMASLYPDSHEHLAPRLMPYTHDHFGIDSPARAWLLRSFEIVLSLLLVVVSVNVAVLVYARTAARTGEIAVRTALGASRRRIVAQLFAEALVVSLIAALAGLALASLGFRWILELVSRGEGVPFWVSLRLSPALVGYIVTLAVVAAIIAGVVPALQATGHASRRGLQQLQSGGSQLRLGGTWTALIVTQVAFAVAALPYALYLGVPSILRGVAEQGYPVDELIRASLALESEGASALPNAAARTRFVGSAGELSRRLEAEPAVAGVALASHFPGAEQVVVIEIEGNGARESVWLNQVETDLFTVLDVAVDTGRGFVESDADPGSSVVIVDRVFAQEVFGDGRVLGRRVRLAAAGDGRESFPTAPGPWLEIVGVVPAFTVPPALQPLAPKLYQPLDLLAAQGRLHLAVRMAPGAAPVTFLGRVREIADSIDPDFRLLELQTAANAELLRREGLQFLATATAAVMGSVLLLSAAGVYAMMSFTVASRRREIGIRAALGATPRRTLSGILGRAARQLGGGVVSGLVVAEAVARVAGGSLLTGEGAPQLATVVVLVIVTGLLAALGPARRGLAVAPSEALRSG